MLQPYNFYGPSSVLGWEDVTRTRDLPRSVPSVTTSPRRKGYISIYIIYLRCGLVKPNTRLNVQPWHDSYKENCKERCNRAVWKKGLINPQLHPKATHPSRRFASPQSINDEREKRKNKARVRYKDRKCVSREWSKGKAIIEGKNCADKSQG